MKRKLVNEDVQPRHDEPLFKAVQECQAYLGGILGLLISKKIISEEEFQQWKTNSDRYLEDRRTRNSREQEEELLADLSVVMRQIVASLKEDYPEAYIQLLLPAVSRDAGNEGLFVRLVSPQLDRGAEELHEHRLLGFVYRAVTASPLANYFSPVTVMALNSQDAEHDPLSLRFSVLARRARLAVD